MICHYPDRSCDQNLYYYEYIINLVYCMTYREHLFKGLYEFSGGSRSHRVPTLPCFIAIGIRQVEI